MNTTIHFIQENNINQITSNTTNSYNWSNIDTNNNEFSQANLPMQQIHYVDSNIALINGNFNNKNVSFLQMNSVDQQNCSTSNSSLINENNLMISNNEENQLTYLTPVINVTINEPQKTVNKLLPLNIETVNSANIYQQVNYVNSNNSLPSMAASFGSPILVNNYEKTNKINKSNKTSNVFKNNWSNNSKPGRKPLVAKTNEKQSKYSNEFSVNNLNKTIKRNSTIQTKNRKKIASHFLNKSLITSSNTNNIKSNVLNNSNNSINSISSTNSAKLTTSSTNTILPQSVARRNERERNRVKQVNLGFNTLRSKLPNPGKKMSKVQTLRCAVEHIKYLHQLLQQSNSIDHYHINTNLMKNNIQETETCKNNQPNKMPKNNLVEINNQLNVLQSMDYYDLDAY